MCAPAPVSAKYLVDIQQFATTQQVGGFKILSMNLCLEQTTGQGHCTYKQSQCNSSSHLHISILICVY